MTDIPIIFSAPMVRALLDGRKTMTRRILKPQPVPFLIDGKPCDVGMMHVEGDPRPRITIGRVVTTQQIRFAKGDRLWVRENFARNADQLSETFMDTSIVFAADGAGRALDNGTEKPWTPSIHMPRWASRITLIVSTVKIERLQDISEADAIAEGVLRYDGKFEGCYAVPGTYAMSGTTSVECFSRLWMSLHGAGAWDANPFVVATSFRVVKANIDT